MWIDFWKTAVFPLLLFKSRLGLLRWVQACLLLDALELSWQVHCPLQPVIGSVKVFLVSVFSYQVNTQTLERRPLIPSWSFRSSSESLVSPLEVQLAHQLACFWLSNLEEILLSRQPFLSWLFLINGSLSLSFLIHFFLFQILSAVVLSGRSLTIKNRGP